MKISIHFEWDWFTFAFGWHWDNPYKMLILSFGFFQVGIEKGSQL